MDFSGTRDWSMPASTGALERRRDQRTRGGWERRVVPEDPLAWSVFSRTGR